jgi:DNA invertase Pin-like site-specific DNA recombinase
MSKKLDAAKIEQARAKKKSSDKRQEAKAQIQQDLEQASNSHVTVIEPTKQYSPLARKQILRAGAYVRVSTQEEAQIGSFEMQMQHFKKTLGENPNYEIVKIYSDEGISGTQTINRLGFQEMLADAKAGKLDVIFTKSITRFGRNAADILSTLQMLDALSPPVTVVFESDNVDTADGKSKIVISIMSALAELESQLKSEAVRAGIRYRMSEGIYKFSVSNTLGFYRDYTGAIRIDENEAEIVRYIYDEFLDGASPQEIADALTANGISSPKGKERWPEPTIRSILSNEKYCGDVLYQKTFTPNFITHASKKNSGELRQWHWTERHAAIIPKVKWLAAQDLLREKAWSSKKIRLRDIPKRFVVSRVKSGPLAGFYLIDPEWDAEDREKFLSLIRNIPSTKNTEE